MANRKTPSPFKVRGKWRAQVTLKNGSRPCKDFEKREDAKQHIADALSNHNSEHDAKLDGPTQATLADALTYYAGVYTINKGGATAELNRINHYLEGAGRQPLHLETDEVGVKSVQETERKRGPSAFAQHNDERRSLRNATYKRISMLARKKCSAINKADIRELMSDMEREDRSGPCGVEPSGGQGSEQHAPFGLRQSVPHERQRHGPGLGRRSPKGRPAHPSPVGPAPPQRHQQRPPRVHCAAAAEDAWTQEHDHGTWCTSTWFKTTCLMPWTRLIPPKPSTASHHWKARAGRRCNASAEVRASQRPLPSRCWAET